MNPTQTKPPTPPRRIAWFVWLGVVLLGVTALGASKSLESNSESTPTPAKSTDLLAGGFGHVDVEGGVVNIYYPGEVVEVIAKDGDDVEKGDPLFRLDKTVAQNDLDRARKAVLEAELQLEAAHNKDKLHHAGVDIQHDVVKAKQSKARIAEAQAAKSQQLFDRKLLGKEELQQATEAVAAFTSEAKAEERKELAMQTEGVDELKIAVRRAQNDLEEKKLLVNKAQFGLDKCTVKAPAKGKVLRMFVAAGDTLGPTPQKPAVQFAAADPKASGFQYSLIIRAEIDQEFAGRVRADKYHPQPAQIQDDARGGATWTGKVDRVSDWYTHRRSILMEPLQFNDVRTLEVIIKLDNAPSDLKIGQRVRVTLK